MGSSRWQVDRDPHPLGPTAFASLDGMLTDRFGETWIVGAMKESYVPGR